MPFAAPRPCAVPGCPSMQVRRGYCEAHHRERIARQESGRRSASRRGYDATWQRLRRTYLRQNPLCQCDDCQGGVLRVTPAEVVDHCVPIEERPDLRLVWGNLRAMSKAHHDAHTARTRGFGKASNSATVQLHSGTG